MAARERTSGNGIDDQQVRLAAVYLKLKFVFLPELTSVCLGQADNGCGKRVALSE
jgi:hypothetical protein